MRLRACVLVMVLCGCVRPSSEQRTEVVEQPLSMLGPAVPAPGTGQFPTRSGKQTPVISTIPFSGQSLVVWTDDREGRMVIWASRLGPVGAPLDLAGMRLSAAAEIASEPAVTWNGQTWLVAWTGAVPDAGRDIWAATVPMSGTPSPPFLVAGGAPRQDSPALASMTVNGTGVNPSMLVWVEGQSSVKGVRWFGGSVLDGGFSFGESNYDLAEPALAGARSFYLAFTERPKDGGPSNVGGMWFDDAGQLEPVTHFSIVHTTFTGASPSVAASQDAGPRRALIAWAEQSTSLPLTTLSGAALDDDPTGFEPGVGVVNLRVAATPTRFVAVYDERGTMPVTYTLRVGEVVPGAPVRGLTLLPSTTTGVIGSHRARLATEWGPVAGEQAQVVYFDLPPLGASSVVRQRVSFDVVTLPPANIVSTSGPSQTEPRVAWAGSKGMTVWVEDRSPDTAVVAAPVDVSGSGVVSFHPSNVVSMLDGSARSAPAIAWDGASTFLVVWVETPMLFLDSTVEAAFIDPAGQLVNAGILTLDGQVFSFARPAVAHDGTTFVVAWPGFTGGWKSQRLSSSGALIGPAYVDSSPDTTAIDLACQTARCVLVTQANGNVNANEISGAGISTLVSLAGASMKADMASVSAGPGTDAFTIVLHAHPSLSDELWVATLDASNALSLAKTPIDGVAWPRSGGEGPLVVYEQDGGVPGQTAAVIEPSSSTGFSTPVQLGRGAAPDVAGDQRRGVIVLQRYALDPQLQALHVYAFGVLPGSDSGTPFDAGLADAGSGDAGFTDGGSMLDAGAGTPDGGSAQADGGEPQADGGPGAGGEVKFGVVPCGCSTDGSSGSLALALLAWAARRPRVTGRR